MLPEKLARRGRRKRKRERRWGEIEKQDKDTGEETATRRKSIH